MFLYAYGQFACEPCTGRSRGFWSMFLEVYVSLWKSYAMVVYGSLWFLCICFNRKNKLPLFRQSIAMGSPSG